MLKPFIYARRTGEPDWPDDPDPGYYEEFERFSAAEVTATLRVFERGGSRWQTDSFKRGDVL